MSVPRISVVIPTLNAARYLAEAIDSVLAQDVAVELTVVDGGSEDATAKVAADFGHRVQLVHARGSRQSEAIQQGLESARGDVLAWLNADDRWTPGAAARALAALDAHPDACLAYGDGELVDTDGVVLAPFDATCEFDLWRLVHVEDFILQPTVFVRAAAFREVGGLDVDLEWTMDWDLWIRMAQRWPVVRVRAIQAQERQHEETKTARGGWARWREIRRVARRHGAGSWSPAVRIYGLDTLRKQWPAVFGASSHVDLAALQGRAWPRLMWPMHRAVSHCIERYRGRKKSRSG